MMTNRGQVLVKAYDDNHVAGPGTLHSDGRIGGGKYRRYLTLDHLR